MEFSLLDDASHEIGTELLLVEPTLSFFEHWPSEGFSVDEQKVEEPFFIGEPPVTILGLAPLNIF